MKVECNVGENPALFVTAKSDGARRHFATVVPAAEHPVDVKFVEL
jgi:hypothetical protein